jgi:hypothetical protein
MATDTTTPTNLRDEFRNTTDGFVGVVQFVGPEEGSHAAGEEVATPQAIMQPKPERATPARTHGRRRST